jgi:hypothetical protein
MFTDMVYATGGGRDDVVVVAEIAYKQRLASRGIALATAVGHRLATTGLRQGVIHVAAETFQQFQRGDTYFRKVGIDKTGNK